MRTRNKSAHAQTRCSANKEIWLLDAIRRAALRIARPFCKLFYCDTDKVSSGVHFIVVTNLCLSWFFADFLIATIASSGIHFIVVTNDYLFSQTFIFVIVSDLTSKFGPSVPLGAIQVIRNAFFLDIGPPPTPS